MMNIIDIDFLGGWAEVSSRRCTNGAGGFEVVVFLLFFFFAFEALESFCGCLFTVTMTVMSSVGFSLSDPLCLAL